MLSHILAGTYVAILNKTNFEGHYVRVFEYPGKDVVENDASWYYLNRIDFTGCLEAVYPVEIFSELNHAKNIAMCAWCHKIRIGGQWMTLPQDPQSFLPHSVVSHGICTYCLPKVKQASEALS